MVPYFHRDAETDGDRLLRAMAKAEAGATECGCRLSQSDRNGVVATQQRRWPIVEGQEVHGTEVCRSDSKRDDRANVTEGCGEFGRVQDNCRFLYMIAD